MADRTAQNRPPGAIDDAQWSDIAMVMAPGAGCDCQMLAMSLAQSMRSVHPMDAIAATTPKRKH